MSLVGNLEDLGLGDILQIVSLSRKSGVLNLNWDERKGRIIFRDGQVVGAESNERPERIDEILPQKGVSSIEHVKEAISLQKGLGEAKSIREILTERLGIDSQKIEDVVREHVDKVIFGFFMWPEGNFSFELKEGDFSKEELGEREIELILDSGLNPQFLAMEGTRLQDEAKRDGTFQPVPMPEITPTVQPKEESPQTEPPAQAPASVPGPTAEDVHKPRAGVDEEISREIQLPQVIVLDDDPEIMNMTLDLVRGLGLSAEGGLKISEGIERIKQIAGQGFCPVVIVDLFMPRTDGEGILGGLELVKIVKAETPYVPVLLMSDYTNEAAQKEAEQSGLDIYIDKPKRSQIWGPEITPELKKYRENIARVVPELVGKAIPPSETEIPPRQQTQQPSRDVAPQASVVPGPPVVSTEDSLWDPGREIRLAIGEEPNGVAQEDGLPSSRGLNLLKSMISELQDPQTSGQVTLLVLRFAAELMNRAIIFLVMKDKVAGLGQFGVELNGVDPLRQVRRMRIPINEPNIFRDVIFRRTTYKKPLADTEWNNYMVQFLGGVRPVESFAAPLITGGKVAAILYGDNVPEEEPIGETDSLEIFLAQAGLTMERTLLERKLHELSDRDDPAGGSNSVGI